MSKTTIYYFSATGNSLAVARGLAEMLDTGDPISVPGSLVNKDPYIDALDAKSVGFVFPVQRATIPEMLRGFIQSMPIDPNCYYFAVSTYSLFGSNEFWDIDELLAEKRAELNYAAAVRMMGNVGLREPSENTIRRRLNQMEKRVEEIATAVAYHQENFFPRSNKVLGKAVRVFTDIRRRKIVFHIDSRCKKCGICAQVCPAQNIELPTKGSQRTAPIRSDKCEACLACVHWCPAAAISTSLRRHVSYHNPTVLPEELHTKLPQPPRAQSDGIVLPENIENDDFKFDAELAAALRNEQLTAADIDDWLKNNSVEETSFNMQFYPTPESLRESSMSDTEIVKALSDLES